jgi:hypothetical protein
LAVSFVDGFVGVVGNNTQDATNRTSFATLGIDSAVFRQDSSSNVFEKAQGNDIPGVLRIAYDGDFTDLPGNMVFRWRQSNGDEWSVGFLADASVNVTLPLRNGDLVIDGGLTQGSSSIGLAVPRVSFNSGANQFFSNAATNSVLDSLNTILAANESNAPSLAPTVNALTTQNTTPTLSGGMTLATGEYLQVSIGERTYENGDGYLSLVFDSGTSGSGSWSLAPATALPVGTYDVEARVWNTDGFSTSDTTSNELTVQSQQTSSMRISGAVLKPNGSPYTQSMTVALYKLDTNATYGFVDDTTTSSADGSYAFTVSGAGTYQVRFGTGASDRKVRGRPKGPKGKRNSRFVDDIVLAAGESATDVDGIAIDPSGVVYDTLTRTAIEGATVTFEVDQGAGWQAVDNTWLDTNLGDSNPKITAADGLYEFFLNSNAPDTATPYRLVVTPPAGYTFQSNVIAADATLTPGLGGDLVAVQPQGTAPVGTQDTTYHLGFVMQVTTDLATSSDGVINNHIPVDPDPSASNSTLVVSDASVQADGVTTATLTAQLVHPDGTPFTYGGAPVTMSTDLGTVTGVTDQGDGTYTAELSSSVAGTATAEAFLDGVLIGTVSVAFQAEIQADANQSTVAVSHGSVPADDRSTSTVTVTVRDGAGLLLSGKTVSVATVQAGVTIAPQNAFTNAAGEAEFTVKSATAQTASFQATVAGSTPVTVTQQTDVTFDPLTAPVPNPAQSSLAADRASDVNANGADGVTLTVQLTDDTGDPVNTGGHDVRLETTLGTLSEVTDNGDGSYTSRLTSDDDGTATVSGVIQMGSTVYDLGNLTVTFRSQAEASSSLTLTNTTPLHQATGVQSTTELSATFSRDLTVGTGQLKVWVGESVWASWDAADAAVEGDTVTVTLPRALPLATTLSVTIDAGFVAGTGGETFGGLTDKTAWQFTTMSIAEAFEPNREAVADVLQLQATTRTQAFLHTTAAQASEVRGRLVERMQQDPPAGVRDCLELVGVPPTEEGDASVTCGGESNVRLDAAYDSRKPQDGRLSVHQSRETEAGPWTARTDLDASLVWSEGQLAARSYHQRVGAERAGETAEGRPYGVGVYLGVQHAREDVVGDTQGRVDRYGVSAFGQAAMLLKPTLAADIHGAISVNTHHANLQVGGFDATGSYASYGGVFGVALTGEMQQDAWTLRPTLEGLVAATLTPDVSLSVAQGSSREALTFSVPTTWQAGVRLAPQLVRADVVTQGGQDNWSDRLQATPHATCSVTGAGGSTGFSCAYGVSFEYAVLDEERRERLALSVGYDVAGSRSSLTGGLTLSAPF